jgi:K+-sensing histidine kinase KdpD
VPQIDRRQVGTLVAVTSASLALASVAVALLETNVGVPNASIVYLAAVVATAIIAGLPGAVVLCRISCCTTSSSRSRSTP